MSGKSHDEWCESEFVHGPMAYSPCDCANRAELRRRGFTVTRPDPAAEPQSSFGDVALWLLSRITKLYRSFDGEDNELTRSAMAAAERLLADVKAEATS